MKRIVSIFTLVCFMLTTLSIGSVTYAQELILPKPGSMINLSPNFNPPVLKGIRVHPEHPFQFDFILDKGEDNLNQQQLKDQADSLIKYFLASLTIPQKDMWVNLSPYEKDRIVPDAFGLTEMGRDLLAQDYVLKQITASLIYPEGELGKKFWKSVYQKAVDKFGTSNVAVNTFNKVWIVPEKAVVYENANAGTAYIVESKLKVMLEEDYLSLKKNNVGSTQDNHSIGNQVIREVVIPMLSKEVNEGKNFAKLRQVYQSLVLATWYKKKIRNSVFSQVYANQAKIAGVNIDNPKDKEKIYQNYLQAFKKGVYNYIKEEPDVVTQKLTPRKYFSGGMQFDADVAMTTIRTMTNIGVLTSALFLVGCNMVDTGKQDVPIASKTLPNNLVTDEFWKQKNNPFINQLASIIQLYTQQKTEQGAQEIKPFLSYSGGIKLNEEPIGYTNVGKRKVRVGKNGEAVVPRKAAIHSTEYLAVEQINLIREILGKEIDWQKMNQALSRIKEEYLANNLEKEARAFIDLETGEDQVLRFDSFTFELIKKYQSLQGLSIPIKSDTVSVYTNGLIEGQPSVLKVKLLKEVDFPKGQRSNIGTPVIRPTQQEDNAMLKGGIDFDSQQINMQIKNNGQDIEFQMDFLMLRKLKDSIGFKPADIRVTPLTDLNSFLGLN